MNGALPERSDARVGSTVDAIVTDRVNSFDRASDQARLFIGCRPGPAIREALERLPRPNLDGVRWTPPHQWHVTLRFFPSADPNEVADAVDGLLRSELAAATPPTATYGPQVARWNRNTIIVPVAGLESIAGVFARITPDQSGLRRFVGHLTLGRIRPKNACAVGGELVTAGLLGARIEGVEVVNEIELVRSELHHDGAVHETLRTWMLGPGTSED